MTDNSTEQLNQVLGSTHLNDYDQFCDENKKSFVEGTEGFSVYLKERIIENGLTQQKVFLNADIPERYGYKLLSGEKRTRQRDVILRICYSAKLTLDETQRALRLYELPELYVKMARDALLMIMFNERPGSILDVNAILKDHGFDPLRTSGVQE